MPDTKISAIQLPPAAEQIIDAYLHLKLGNQTVRTPYFMNEKGKRGTRAQVGKGTAQEIENAVRRVAQQHGFSLDHAQPEEIRQFMIQHEIGIDCSGFAAWILNELVKDRHYKPLWQCIDFGMHPVKAHIIKRLRAIENISVRTLTDPANSIPITDLKKARVGDMIRTRNGHHILLIREIGYTQAQQPSYFRYINSTEYDGTRYGIRGGVINIINPNGTLLDQQWIDDESATNWIYESTKEFPEDTRIMRLKALAD